MLAACSATDKQTATEGVFTYEHDPRENPNAMKDIIENPDAVYGFSPSPESDRLKEYVDACLGLYDEYYDIYDIEDK